MNTKPNERITPVILCGGSGTRLWPLSRESYPKQFVNLGDGRTLFRDTLLRLRNLEVAARPLIVCNEKYRFYVGNELRSSGIEGDLILEPAPRNTAPAIALAAFDLLERDNDLPMLILPADHHIGDKVKNIVGELKRRGSGKYKHPPLVYRPWGSYEVLAAGDRFQVKRIIVNPGEILSLQMHYHRAEHWIVVSGTAEVTNGEETNLFTENQSTYIPIGKKHRLRNPGAIPLVIIEIQSGSYLGEDDIVRIEDIYGR